jgi:hypothetical protein
VVPLWRRSLQTSTVPTPFVSPNRRYHRPRPPRMPGSGVESSRALRARLQCSVVSFAAAAVAPEPTNRCYSVPYFRFVASVLSFTHQAQRMALCKISNASFTHVSIACFNRSVIFCAGWRAIGPRQKPLGSNISIAVEPDASNGSSQRSGHRFRRTRSISPRQWQQCDIRRQVWCACISDHSSPTPSFDSRISTCISPSNPAHAQINKLS